MVSKLEQFKKLIFMENDQLYKWRKIDCIIFINSKFKINLFLCFLKYEFGYNFVCLFVYFYA